MLHYLAVRGGNVRGLTGIIPDRETSCPTGNMLFSFSMYINIYMFLFRCIPLFVLCYFLLFACMVVHLAFPCKCVSQSCLTKIQPIFFICLTRGLAISFLSIFIDILHKQSLYFFYTWNSGSYKTATRRSCIQFDKPCMTILHF